MTRLLLISGAVLALLVPATASAATYTYEVPDLVKKPLIAVKRANNIPVLLPSFLRTEHRRLFSEGRGRASRYSFDIGAARNCRTATACHVVSFRARRGAKPSNRRKVDLIRGRTGYFRPLRCGASCAAPSLEWRQGGVLYTIEGKLGTRRTDRRILKRLANSAIRNGAR